MIQDSNIQPGSSGLHLLALLDILTIMIVCFSAFYIVSIGAEEPLDIQIYITPTITFTIMVVLYTAAFGLYGSQRAIFSWNTLRRLSLAWFLIVATVALIAVVTKTNYTYSRSWFLLSTSFGYFFSLCWRIILNKRAKLELSKMAKKLDILAVGYGDGFDKTVDRLVSNERHPYRSVRRWQWDNSRYPTLTQQLSALDEFVADATLTQLWVIGSELDNHASCELITHFNSQLVQIYYFPDFSFLPTLRPVLERRADLPSLSLSVKPLQFTDRWLKSIFDRIFSVFTLLLLSPLMLVLAVGVKLSSPGPILYRQVRLTRNGRPFEMFKFRSMPVTAEQESGPVWASKGESRATKFGGFLRKSSLDELPQFINVLLGQMSVVGPRPERPHFVEQFQHTVPAYMQKHYVKAGITGWAQINGLRGNTSIEQRVEHDIFYIRNWSIWLDLKIVVLTVFKGFVSESAY